MENHTLDIMSIMLQAGLVVKAVLIVLLLASVLSWTIIFVKRKLYQSVEKENDDFLKSYNESSSDLLEKCSEGEFSTYKVIYRFTYEELNKWKGKENQSNAMDSFQRAINQGVIESNIILEDKMSLLASVGSISPFIGLFGTVWGIINSFTGLAGGGATLDAVAPGIAEALVATAIGLVAAIPAVYYFNHYGDRSSTANSKMEKFSQTLLNDIQRSL